MYANLKSALDRFDALLKSKDTGARHPVTLAAELLPANSNRGAELLRPQTLQGTILYLDRLKEMGIQGVTISIGYPIYTPDFPGYQSYVYYFKQVAEEVRRRGMKLDVETGVVFTNTVYSTTNISFAGLTYDRFKEDVRQMVAAIVRDLQPDYLNIGGEPDTHAALLGMPELNTAQKYTEYVNHVLSGLNRGKTKIAAGTGSWTNPAFAESLAKNTTLDCIAIHVYPVTGENLPRAIAIAETAKRYNKGVTLDECWLYKVDTLPSSGIAATAEVFRRDAFSFWEPLDKQFLGLMVKFARMYGIEYLSPFWANFFFANLEYNQATSNLSYTEIVTQANAKAVENITAGRFSPIGELYRKLITDNR